MAKKCLAEARASSLLASLVLKIVLEGSTGLNPCSLKSLPGTVFAKVLGDSSVAVTTLVEGHRSLISFSGVHCVSCFLLDSSTPPHSSW